MANLFKEVYTNVGTNAAAIVATQELVIESQQDALLNNNLPHNGLVMTNQSTTCTLFIFLDNFIDETKPNYVLFPTQTISVPREDGISFTTLFVKNTHTATDVAIGELKYNISTIKNVGMV